MITPRNVILTVLVAMSIALTWRVLDMLGPPDSDGRAADSYGTRTHGQRGMYETMSELGLPVSRSLEPPGTQLPLDTTVVIWKPDGRLVSFEPRFLQQLGDWVLQGGRVVVTPPDESPFMDLLTEEGLPVQDAAATLREALHLPPLEFSSAYGPVIWSPGQQGDAPDTGPELPSVVIDVEPRGQLADLAADVRTLEGPQKGFRSVSSPDADPTGELIWHDAEDEEHAAVQTFRVGSGEVVVIADERLFSNQWLAKADNSVLAVRLLLGDRQRVRFNEFYHGLSVRGNALWLLTRRGYALLAAAVIAVVAVVTWRSAVLLGPPLTTPAPSRRTVAEYIDAMSRFLHRGRRTRSRLLQEVYSGTLRRIAAEYGLTHSREDAQAVARAVERRERGRAERIRAAVAAVDAVLAKHDKATEHETVQALRQLQDCLGDFRF